MIFRSPFPDVAIPNVTLTEYVLRGTAGRADKPAIIDGPSGRSYSYGQLAGAIRRAAAGLTAHGLRQGEVCAIYSPNLPEYAIAFHAVATLGAISTTINPLYTVDELRKQLEDAQAKYLITVPPLLDKARAAAQAAGIREIFVFGEAEGATPFAALLQQGDTPPAVTIEPGKDLVVLPYSSGTTGLSKGVMLTHTNLIENYNGVIDVYPFTKQHTFVCVLPLFHSFGMTGMMLLAMALGSRVVLVPQFLPQKLAEIFNTYPRCVFFGVAPMFQVLALQAKSKGIKYENLELCVSGAAALPNDVKNLFEAATGIDLYQGYGLSEASPVVSLNLPGQHKPGTIGKTIRGVDLEIWSDESEKLPNGEIGEIMVRGKNVMKGYYKNPDVTAQTISGDWLHTGDLGRLDDDGYTTIVGRKKELIISAGENIYPLEIEDVLTSHPAVREAAVIGIPHPSRGEDAKAYVSLHEGASVEISELRNLCRERLAAYKVPAEFEIREDLPKSPTGKILKRVLVSEIAG